LVAKTLKYALFAGIATVSNIGTQWISLQVYPKEKQYALYIAMALGTLVGLLIKYVLDKLFIFYYKTKSATRNLFKFFIYCCMGIVTTIIFWSTELIFDYFFSFDAAEFIGAFLGLTIGYTIKYFLDKHFVFVDWW